mmetsp:Transcript_31168/g.74011  ORF Transcript_31168/g.74011 Transcript_31168/m.74011 type:complete len:166 (-) Transcript_31168:138-635(-)
MEYHSQHKSACAGVLTKAELDAIHFRAQKCPTLLLPVAKAGGGYFVLAAQYAAPSQEGTGVVALPSSAPKWFLTPLDDFRLNPDAAEAVFGISVHTELIDSKDLALARADFYDGGMISKAAAEKLLRDLFFCYWDTAAFKDVQKMNHSGGAFEWEAFAQKMLSRE